MAACGSCGNTILFGGKRNGAGRFCSKKCLQRGVAFSLASTIPDDIVLRHTYEIYQGNCPQCDGPGPVDVHTSYRVWSAVYQTSWSSRPKMSCRRCGTKGKLQDILFSLLLGWWGIPFGLLATPVQIVRNLAGLARKPRSGQPSPELEQMVRHALAGRLAQS